MLMTAATNTANANGDNAMIFASQFINYINGVTAPAVLIAEVKREARKRIIERMQVGRADAPLTFDDLVLKIENAIAPK